MQELKELVALFEQGKRIAKARKDKDAWARYEYAIQRVKALL